MSIRFDKTVDWKDSDIFFRRGPNQTASFCPPPQSPQMQQADEIARDLERQLQASTQKMEAFVSQQAAALARAQQDHEQLMRDMEGA